MTMLATHRRRREAIYQTTRRSSAGGWRADLLHLAGSILLMAVIIGVRVWWYLHNH